MIPEGGKNIALKDINEILQSKKRIHGMLSSDFVLPEVTCHACTIEYLIKYSLNPIPIFTCPVEGTLIFKHRYKWHNAVQLLDILEDLLKAKDLPPTGMDPLHLPNVDWLCTILHRIDLKDELNLFSEISESQVNRIVNPK